MKNFELRLSPSLVFYFDFFVVLCFLVWAISFSMTKAINVPTLHVDGAFQTASGLFRLDSGQFPGKDFFPYLGIGPLFTLYPAFKASGSDLSASVFSAQFMTLISGGLSVSVISHLIVRPKSIFSSLATGAVFFVTPVVAAKFFFLPLHHSIAFAVDPGNSLRSIRVMAPYLVVIFYYLLLFDIKTARLKYALSGILTGSILLWSNDFALPTAGFFALFIVFKAFSKNEFKKNALIYAFALVLSWAGLLCLSTDNHPIALLKYNFLDVAKDQWWYFVPYGGLTRIFSLQQVSRLISEENIFPLIVLGLTVIVFIKTRSVEYALVAWIGLVLFAGGALASIGGHLQNYFQGFFFWGLMTFVIACFHLVFLGIENKPQELRFELAIIPIASVIVLIAAINEWNNFKINLANAKNDPNRFYVSELGGYLGVEWKDYINLARQTDTKQVIEEYWGLWSATRKISSLWPVDSVIHALGHTRDIARETIQDAEIIISTRNSASPEWQPWNLSQNFWFYDELVKNWRPQQLSPTTVVWHKSMAAQHLDTSVNCILSSDNHSISLIDAKPGFYRVTLEYDFLEKGRHLLMAENNISFAEDAEGYISIDTSGRKAVFPAYIPQPGTVRLNIKIVGNSEYNLKLNSCSINKILFVHNEVLHVPEEVKEKTSF
jgi:hypothetical protein